MPGSGIAAEMPATHGCVMYVVCACACALAHITKDTTLQSTFGIIMEGWNTLCSSSSSQMWNSGV